MVSKLARVSTRGPIRFEWGTTWAGHSGTPSSSLPVSLTPFSPVVLGTAGGLSFSLPHVPRKAVILERQVASYNHTKVHDSEGERAWRGDRGSQTV